MKTNNKEGIKLKIKFTNKNKQTKNYYNPVSHSHNFALWIWVLNITNNHLLFSKLHTETSAQIPEKALETH